MDFDVRFREFTFKHTESERPDPTEGRFQEHFHTGYELLYFVRGDADLMLKHTLYKLKPGSLLVIKPGEYHYIVFRSDAPYERYLMRFSPLAIYPKVLKKLEQSDSVYYVESTPLKHVFRHMDTDLEMVHRDMQGTICIGFMNIVIAHLISLQGMTQKADYVNAEVKKIVDYIDANLTQIYAAEDVAKALHISKSALYKAFSAQFGVPIMSYIRTQKCMIARNLLSEGAAATEVAERLGFNHYSSFYRDYCKIFGAPPTSVKTN